MGAKNPAYILYLHGNHQEWIQNEPQRRKKDTKGCRSVTSFVYRDSGIVSLWFISFFKLFFSTTLHSC